MINCYWLGKSNIWAHGYITTSFQKCAGKCSTMFTCLVWRKSSHHTYYLTFSPTYNLGSIKVYLHGLYYKKRMQRIHILLSSKIYSNIDHINSRVADMVRTLTLKPRDGFFRRDFFLVFSCSIVSCMACMIKLNTRTLEISLWNDAIMHVDTQVYDMRNVKNMDLYFPGSS